MILSNQIKCKKCEDEIFSANVHDFRTCSCGAVSVDGGMSYLRRVGNSSDYTEMSIEIDDRVYRACKKAVQWSNETGRNELGMVSAIFRALRDIGYLKNVKL